MPNDIATTLIMQQMRRQIDGLCAHDDGEFVTAALAYVGAARQCESEGYPPYDPHPGADWPWEPHDWRPANTAMMNLVQAAALLAAEINRLAAAC